MGKGLSYLKKWGVVVNYCWNYGLSKLLLHFIKYRLDQLNSKHTKIAVNSTIFLGPPTAKWRSCKTFTKLIRSHLLMANIFKLHEPQTFGLMKMHNMFKIWYANNIFSLLRWNKKYFSWLFKGLSIAKNCPTPVNILNNKRELLCNFAKKIRGRHFMRHSDTDFQLPLNSKSSKLPSIVF